MRGWAGAIGRWIAAWEPVCVLLAAPFLLFPAQQPGWTAAVLGAMTGMWLLRWMGTGRPGTRTPLDVALLVLALTIPVAVWASALPELTLPKLTGLILGLAAFRAVTNGVHTPRHLGVAAACFLALGLGLAALGLLGTHWAGKWPGLTPMLARIPQPIGGLPGAERGIHPNELGGALLLFLPVAVAAVGARERAAAWQTWASRAAALLLSLLLGAVLVLSQSRGAWIGAVAGLGAMLWVRWRRMRGVLALAGLVLALGLVYAGPQTAVQAAFASAGLGDAGNLASTINLEGRLELWSRALYAIQDFPFTGCGLGTFRRVVQVLYPLFLIGPDADLGHAHNVFLQVALDLGLPGLVAYLALVGTALWIGWRLATSGPGALQPPHPHRWLALGIVGALVAFHTYGLTDTIALGAKPGVALWVLLGLAAALWRTSQETGTHQPAGCEDA
jgi:putative inorganic carbon (HCO3(-)) transporter